MSVRVQWDLGDGLWVRSLDLGDADAVFALVEANRERLRPWMHWEPATQGPEDTRAFIERSRASATDMEANGLWLEGVLAGTMGMSIDTLANAGMIGYWIDGAHQGRGLVTRAAERFLVCAFDELELHRMELHAAVDNVRSRAVADRLGMREEGVLREAERVHGGYHDMVVYGLLEDEWRARRA